MSFELSLVQGAYPIKQYSVCCLKTSNLAEFLVLGNTHLETPDSVRKVCRFSSSHIKLTRTPQQLYTRSWFPESNSVIMISTTTKKHKLIVANHGREFLAPQSGFSKCIQALRLICTHTTCTSEAPLQSPLYLSRLNTNDPLILLGNSLLLEH